MVGKNVESYPDIVKTAYLDGNIIGNHTYSHFYLSHLSEDEVRTELSKASEAICKIVHKYPLLFRPPYGACSYSSTAQIGSLGFVTIGWCAMTNDYDVDHTISTKIAEDILRYVRPGGIIGLHDGGGNREKTVQALRIIISELKAQGYEFLTIPELLSIDPYR